VSVTAKFDEKHAFVLYPEQAEHLWALFERDFGPVTATMSCTDRIERTFRSTGELVTYENARNRSIESITFEARSDDYKKRAAVTLGARYSSSIQALIQGPEAVVMSAKNELGEIFDGMKPWYSPVSRIDFYYVVFVVVLFGFMVAKAMLGDRNGPSDPVALQKAVLLSVSVFVFLAFLAGLVWFLNQLRRCYFPSAVFALGQGRTRFELEEKVRWAVIVATVVSIVASMIVALLLR